MVGMENPGALKLKPTVFRLSCHPSPDANLANSKSCVNSSASTGQASSQSPQSMQRERS